MYEGNSRSKLQNVIEKNRTEIMMMVMMMMMIIIIIIIKN